MLSWSHSPLTNCRIGEPSPGMAVALYEFDRSMLYSVGLNRTVITVPLLAPSRTVIFAFSSWGLLIASHSPPLALDPNAALDPSDHILGHAVDHRGVEHVRLGGADRVGRLPGVRGGE